MPKEKTYQLISLILVYSSGQLDKSSFTKKKRAGNYFWNNIVQNFDKLAKPSNVTPVFIHNRGKQEGVWIG
jgi:hypothetical protein